MARTSLDTLTRRVVELFRKRAGQYGLDPAALEARYILNWGGFVNASFTITDGRQSYHLKLADEEESQERLELWSYFSPHLVEKYHAPRVLDWIEIPRTPFAGLLFEHLPGRPADFANQPDLLGEVLDLLSNLHSDPDLIRDFEQFDGPPLDCTETFLSVYIDRFDGDLLIIAGDLPPFVPLSLLDWMQGETRELEGLARDLPAFHHPAASPIHADLWPNNIIVEESGAFHVIDWDDLARGDPALDYSIVLGPLWRSGAYSLDQVIGLLPAGDRGETSHAFLERFHLYLRAYLLDEVIDTLADWVESAFAPAHQSGLRLAKERAHREALELYKKLYR